MSKNRSKSKKAKTNRFLPSLYTLIPLIIGVFFLILYAYWYIAFGPYSLQFNSVPKAFTSSLSTPVSISIPREKLTLSVSEAAITHNQWQVSQTGVSHLAISANPGNKGNIIIYGHNKDELFGNIRNLLPTDQIIIQTKDKKLHKYIVYATDTVSPNDISVIASTNKEVLTLYTCTGFADLERFIVKAYPVV